MKIQRPPHFKLTDETSTALAPMLARYAQANEKGHYLHWDELRFRLPYEEVKPVWFAVKQLRHWQLKDTGLMAESGQPMRFYLTDTAQAVLLQVDQLDNQLQETAKARNGNRYLVRALLMEEAISSAQLEGAATTRQVAKAMLEAERAPQDDDERMVFNNFWLLKLAKQHKDEPLSLPLMLKLQAAAVEGIETEKSRPGELRQSNDVLVMGRTNDEVLHQPPDCLSMPERLENLCHFANTTHNGKDGKPFIHPVVKAVILHFMLGYEHPFNDGNGRTARALFYWYLLKAGYWFFEYISISALLKESAKHYARSYLLTETDDFDLTYFIDHQLQVIEEAVHAFLAFIEHKKRETYEYVNRWERQGIPAKLNVRQIRLLQKIADNPGRVFTVNEVKNDFGLSPASARGDLEKLVELNVLVKFTEGRGNRYIARKQVNPLAELPKNDRA